MELILLFLFITKHLFVDFIWQTPYHYQNKGEYGHWGGIEHALLHTFGSFGVGLIYFFMLPFMDPLPPSPFMPALTAMVFLPIFDGVVHYHMDWFKVNHCKKHRWTPSNSDQWFHWMGIDQYVHYLTYIFMVWVMFDVEI